MLNNSSQDVVAESRPLFGGGTPWRIRLPQRPVEQDIRKHQQEGSG
jgi:hypothetical protein